MTAQQATEPQAPLSADYNAVIETYSARLAEQTHRTIVAEAAARGYQQEAAELRAQLATAQAEAAQAQAPATD